MEQDPNTQAPAPGRKGHGGVFRGNLLIFPKFQLILLGVNLGVLIIVSLFILFQTQSVIRELGLAGGALGPDAGFFRQVLAYSSSSLQNSILGSLMLGLAISAWTTLVVTRRFAGPLIRLRAFFASLADGKYPPEQLRFRKGDFLTDLPPVINQALEKMITKATDTKKRD